MDVKICGIQSAEEAAAAVAAGATALGFLCGLTHRAEDAVSPAQARAIAAMVPPAVRTVLVTHLEDPAAIAALAREIGVRAVQVHGPVRPAGLAALRALLPEVPLVKSVHVTGPEALEEARRYAALADAVLLDSRTADRLGGTGQVHDWDVSAAIVHALAPFPVHLAGGLRPENVAEAVRRVRPSGVDVNSGVEDAAGRKDAAGMRDFIRGATLAGSPQGESPKA